MDLSDMRLDYSEGELRRSSLKDNAFEQFSTWFEQACESDVHEPNAFSLATVSEEGQPSLRTVLLKYFDEEGLVFFTNYESHMIPWPTPWPPPVIRATLSFSIFTTPIVKCVIISYKNTQIEV